MNEIRVPLTSDTITNSEIDQLRDWLGTYPKLTKGDLTLKFEREWSAEVGLRYSTFVNSGSSAILLTLSAMVAKGTLRPGKDKIVVPALSWLTDVSSPINLGFEVVLCDANPIDLSLDLDHLERIFESDISTRAVIVVSVLGLSPDMDRLVKMCRSANATLIEDVCESLGTDFNGNWLGTFGDASVYSLYYGHHVSTIEGGMISTDNEELDSVIRSMRSHGWSRDWSHDRTKAMNELYSINDFQSKYAFFYPGYNLRSTDLQAFIGRLQVPKIKRVADHRHQNFLAYNSVLSNINGLRLSDAISRSNCISNFAYPILFDSSDERSFAATLLEYAGVECRPLIAGSMGRQPFMKGLTSNQQTPFANMIHTQGMYLPNNHSMGQREIDIVAESLEPIVRRRASRKA